MCVAVAVSRRMYVGGGSVCAGCCVVRDCGGLLRIVSVSIPDWWDRLSSSVKAERR